MQHSQPLFVVRQLKGTLRIRKFNYLQTNAEDVRSRPLFIVRQLKGTLRIRNSTICTWKGDTIKIQIKYPHFLWILMGSNMAWNENGGLHGRTHQLTAMQRTQLQYVSPAGTVC